MAWYVFHPVKGQVVSAQKKGKSGNKQLWLEKSTGQKFSTDQGAENYVDQTTGRVLPSYETGTGSENQNVSSSGKKTRIKVNNNVIGEIADDLTVDQAFLLASDYFREIEVNNSVVQDQGNEKTITFKIQSGFKG